MSSIRIPERGVPTPATDSQELHRAFHGVGCDSATVVDILARRTSEQRSQIKKIYAEMYREDLCQRLKSELHFNLKKSVLLWMLDPPQRDAFILREAFTGRASSRKTILIQTLCACNKEQLAAIAEAYESSYHRPLSEDIGAYTEGFCKKFFITLLSTEQVDCGDHLDLGRSVRDAKELFDARKGKINEAVFLEILTSRSRDELLSAFDLYESDYGEGILKALKKAPSGEFQETAMEVIEYIKNPPEHYAKILYKSMKGLGTDDQTLIRVVVSRAEVDMNDIKDEFIKNYKVSLYRTIHSDTSGRYRHFLLALIGTNVAPKGSSFLNRLLSE